MKQTNVEVVARIKRNWLRLGSRCLDDDDLKFLITLAEEAAVLADAKEKPRFNLTKQISTLGQDGLLPEIPGAKTGQRNDEV